MGAEVSIVQFRKLQGTPTVNVITVDPLDVGTAFFFAGVDNYNLSPTNANAQASRVRGGTASWEVWIAARFNGAAFAEISDIFWYMESFDTSGMGTPPSAVTGTYQIDADEAAMPVSGIYMRSAPCAIHLGLPPVPVSSWIPSASPSRGLPASEDGWVLFDPNGPGAYSTEGTGYDPPEVLNLSPHNSSIPPGEELWGSGILVSDPEPRFSNVAVLNLVVALNATLGVRNPAVFAVEWTES